MQHLLNNLVFENLGQIYALALNETHFQNTYGIILYGTALQYSLHPSPYFSRHFSSSLYVLQEKKYHLHTEQMGPKIKLQGCVRYSPLELTLRALTHMAK